MEIKQKVETDLQNAMRTGDENRKRVLRLALSAIKFEEKTKGRPLTDSEQISILQKEIKVRKETIDGAEKAGRKDIIDINLAEIDILEEYLPKQLSDKELELIVEQAIQETHAAGSQDMGKVIKVVIPLVQGRASNELVSKKVKEILGSK